MHANFNWFHIWNFNIDYTTFNFGICKSHKWTVCIMYCLLHKSIFPLVTQPLSFVNGGEFTDKFFQTTRNIQIIFFSPSKNLNSNNSSLKTQILPNYRKNNAKGIRTVLQCWLTNFSLLFAVDFQANPTDISCKI